MTSLLAFAWRKANETNLPANNDEHDFSPAVSASSSGETLTNHANEDSILDSPSTPEGFRPRKAPEAIRRELNLPCNLSQRWQTACSALPPVLSCGSMESPSPQVSTSSFYSRHSTRHVAESPNLGQAKTAVGALVAMSDTRASFHESTNDPITKSSILPPRAAWLDDSKHMHDANDYNGELPYEALNDSHISSIKKHEYQYQIPGQSDDESSIHASPSSTNWRHTLAVQKQQHNTSFTRGFLKMDPNVSNDQYDFHAFGDEDIFMTETSAPSLNMSGISHSTKDLESLHSLVDDADEDEENSEQDSCYKTRGSEEQDFCEPLHRNRMNNQCRIKEDLLVSTLERLQDDPELVFLKQWNGHQADSFRLEEENILTGFSREKRSVMCRNIDVIVNELRATSQEEFMSQFTETRDELEQALSFCRSLVRTAIPSSEKPIKLQFSSSGLPQQGHRWKCVPGFRAALGFDEAPQSPDTVRGGDTSLFSLPSESAADTTPHTSNVSLTTTITSAFSPERNSRQMGYSLERVNLRRALETVSTLFDKLSAACVKLVDPMSAKSDASIKAPAEIKRVYMQLMKLSVEDLKALIDSFELDLLPLQITRPVSEEHGEGAHTRRRTSFPSQPQPLVRFEGHINATAQQLVNQTMGIPIELLKVNVVEDDEEGANLFSPSTEDMNSIEQSTNNTVDDLRRTVGSFDLENVEEEREGPPPSRVPQQAEKNGKKKRGMWRPRYSRRKVAE